MSTTKSKKKTGQFVKGSSGNPSGRPPGSRNKATLLMENLLEGEAKQLTRKVIEMAKAGNMHAMQLCLDRLLVPGRDRLVHFDLPPMSSMEDIWLGMKGIVMAVSEGKLTPQEGEVLSRILSEHANVMHARDVGLELKKLRELDEANVTAIN
jgi:hypothetical protein